LPYDFKGDGYQNGGTMIITKGGEKVLLDWRQENAADHVDAQDVLKILGIPSDDSLKANKAAASTPTSDNGDPGASKM